MRIPAFLPGCLFFATLCSLTAQTPGSLDTTFDPGISGATIWALTPQSDGKILVGGRRPSSELSGVSGVIYRLNSTGSIDTSFDYGARGTSATGTVIPQINRILIQSDGSILVAGQFLYFDETIHLRLARLNSVGALDTTYTRGTGNHIFALVPQPDGRVLVGGNFIDLQGSGQNCFARLNSDGTVDSTFNVGGTGAQSTVNAITVDHDGKILVGGNFSAVNGTPRVRISRLEANGSLDSTFDPDTGADNTIEAILVQPDGKIVIGGWFTTVRGEPRNRLARFNTNGTLDMSFNPDCDNPVFALTMQHGKILAGGRFNTVSGQTRKKIVRLDLSGAIDSAFDGDAGAGTGASDEVRAIKLQTDGKILVSGKFTTFSGLSRSGVARLYGEPPVTSNDPPKFTSVSRVDNNTATALNFSFLQNRVYILQFTTDLMSWTNIYTNTGSLTPTNRVDPSIFPSGFYRIFAP